MIRPLLVAGRPCTTPNVVPIRAPWDGRELDAIAQAGPEELASAAEAAHRSAPAVARLPGHRRADICRGVATRLRSRAEEIAASIRDEGGKPITFARAEVSRAIDTFNLCAEEATRLGGELFGLDGVPAGEGRIALVRRFAKGPVLAIAPFNFPLNLVAHKVGPAVAAGCPVVVKPAEQTPTAALLLGEILVDAGWPAEAISVLPCDRTVASALVDDPRFTVISFTGSDKVGWAIRARAPRKQVVLELGGNAAAILHDDADLAKAVPRVAVGAYAHAGQVCISVQHLLVHASRYDEARERLLSELPRVAAGNPAAEATICGPMIDAYHAGRVESWVAEAVACGARAHGGGREGNLLLPTVVEDAPADAKVSAEEVFGPTLVLSKYSTMEEAIRRVNAGRYGLQCGVFTRDIGAIWAAFDGLEVGGVIHDDYPTFRVDGMPYGGVKDSGVGKEGPRWAIRDFTEERLLVLKP
jgi:acyl-CoA reductase-like NAD-dependent aldehyde dehydrogenase